MRVLCGEIVMAMMLKPKKKEINFDWKVNTMEDKLGCIYNLKFDYQSMRVNPAWEKRKWIYNF